MEYIIHALRDLLSNVLPQNSFISFINISTFLLFIVFGFIEYFIEYKEKAISKIYHKGLSIALSISLLFSLIISIISTPWDFLGITSYLFVLFALAFTILPLMLASTVGITVGIFVGILIRKFLK